MSTEKLSRIILSVCEIVVGVLLLVNPVAFTTGIIVFLGIVLTATGVVNVVRYFRADPKVAALEHGLVAGCLMVLGGLFCALNSEWFIAAFPLLTMLYGVIILVVGVVKVQWSVDMLRLKVKRWFLMGISALVTIACAAIILCNPFSSTAALWVFIAVLLIVEAVFDIVATLLAKR